MVFLYWRARRRAVWCHRCLDAGEAAALQTAEVPCCSSPVFDAVAHHEILLPGAASILPLLQDG